MGLVCSGELGKNLTTAERQEQDGRSLRGGSNAAADVIAFYGKDQKKFHERSTSRRGREEGASISRVTAE